jgi:ABC-type transport system involved in cytochrome c biogenesis permease component
MATVISGQNWLASCRLVFEYSVRSVFIRKASWAGTLAFAACLAILFPFSFGTELIQKAEIRHGAFWAINEFVVALTVGRLFTTEAESGILEMMLAAGLSRSAILFGKILFVVLYLLSVQLPLLVVWIVFYNVPNAALFSVLPTIFPLLLLFNLGTGTIGALLACVTARSTGRDLLMPLLFYPLQLSVLLAAVSLATYTDPAVVMLAGTQGSSWWTLLTGVPVVFLALGVLLSQALFQE